MLLFSGNPTARWSCGSDLILPPIKIEGAIPTLSPQAHFTFIVVYFHQVKCCGGRGRRSAIVQTSWDCGPDLRAVICSTVQRSGYAVNLPEIQTIPVWLFSLARPGIQTTGMFGMAYYHSTWTIFEANITVCLPNIVLAFSVCFLHRIVVWPSTFDELANTIIMLILLYFTMQLGMCKIFKKKKNH